MKILQKEITLKPKDRGFHLVTKEILDAMPEMKKISKGVAHILIKHTSASLSVNENADKTVRKDMESFFNDLVPEEIDMYQHTHEGPDDMTAHIKASILGSSITVPVTDGTFNFGTWQGIYLCEHRNSGGDRSVVVTVFGEER